MIIRPLELGDIQQILQLERELFGPSAWTPGMLKSELNGSGRTYLVAVVGTLIIAYGGIWNDGDVVQIMTIGVRHGYQRQRVGRQLLQALITQAQQGDVAEVFLEVAVDNLAAISLYQSFGFEPIAIRKRYYQPEDVDAYTMRLKLPK